MTLRRLAAIAAAALGALTVTVIAAVLALDRAEFAPSAARYATSYLGRPLAIGTLHLHLGRSLTVELHDLTLDNALRGTQPQQLRVARLTAEIAPLSLLAWALQGHPPLLRRVTIDGARVLIEHTPDDRSNWQFGAPSATRKNLRASFPTLLDARLHDAEIALRTSSGKTLTIRIDDATIAAPDAAAPIALAATGAYNATPLRLTAALQSFDRLHDPATPFDTELHLASADTTLDFAGTMTDPIAVDGCTGRLVLAAPRLDQHLAIAGAPPARPGPLVALTLAGPLTRDGDLWRLPDAQGTWRTHPFHLALDLREGARHAPDDLTIDSSFSTLDLTGLDDGDTKPATSLRIDDAPGTRLAAHVAAQQLAFGTFHAQNLELTLKLAPGALEIERLALRLLGGSAQITAAIANEKTTTAIRLDAAIAAADAGQLAHSLGLGPLPLAGPLDAHASVHFAGNTLAEAQRQNGGALVLSMQGGSVQRKLIEQASADLRLLFGTTTGSSHLACLLGVLDIHDGVARLSPLRLRTADGSIAATGAIDLRRDAVDVIIASESASTGLLALDIPLHIAGPLRNPRVQPAAGNPTTAAADLRTLPPALQDAVRRHPCAAGRK